MTRTFNYSIDSMFEEIEKFTRLQREYKEQTLAEIITKYDFIVGSKECKCKLMEVLPEGANVICSPYIENPTMIYAVKKFDIVDYLFTEPQESEVQDADDADTETWNGYHGQITASKGTFKRIYEDADGGDAEC